MILAEKTFELFGYLPTSLSFGSKKKIVVQCDYCNALVHKKYKDYLTSSSSIVKKDACKQCKNLKAAEMVSSIPGKKESMTRNMVKTNIERFGTAAPMNNVEINAKMKSNNLEKYGTEYHIAAESTRKNIRKTMNQKYGSNHHMQNAAFLNEFKQNMVDKYGVNNAFAIPEVRNKINATIKTTHGVNHNSQIHYTEECMRLIENKYWMEEQYLVNMKSLSQIAQLLGLRSNGHSTIAVWMKKHGIEIRKSCMVSSYEQEIIDYIKTIYPQQIEQSNRTVIGPKEIDIYLPKSNFGIEFCGLYWHSDEFIKDKKYHQDKYLACKEKGVELFTIFEDEWLHKKDIVKRKIRHKLGKNSAFMARKCKIVPVSAKDERTFLENNHIQGYVASKFCYGLEYQGDIVAVMSFGVPRYDNTHEYEILRFASFTAVNGGATKLLSHFEKTHNPKSIISYCNLRYGSGGVYTTMGFNYTHTTNPSYYYVKDGKRIGRQSLTKKKLIETYGLSPDLTESEMTEQLGFSRIYDCGNTVFSKQIGD